MASTNFYNEYKRNAISTSSQGKLILMMYDGAIKFVNLALKNMEGNNVSERCMYIRKAHDIINELSCSLDMNKGGDVVRRLEELYQYMLKQLTLANIKSDKSALESVLRVLKILNEAWEQVIRNESAQSPALAEQPASTPPGKKITAHC